MAKKVWGVGSWADKADLTQHAHEPDSAKPSLLHDNLAFPSLDQAVQPNITKKKKKQQALPLHQFIASSSIDSTARTINDLLLLPTGPRDRSSDDVVLSGALGGGFKGYGGYRSDLRDGGSHHSDTDYVKGGFRGDRVRTEQPQSRADSVNDWGASKKFVASFANRHADDYHMHGHDNFPSTADQDDNWVSSKKLISPPLHRTSRYNFSSSSNGSLHDADAVDNWGALKRSARNDSTSASMQRDKGDIDKWTHKVDRAEAPERPRLVLQPRSLPLQDASLKEHSENQPPIGVASSSVKPCKVNPFGEAKPREVVLAEQGLNWKEQDSELHHKSKANDGRW